jgi:hypothetical protein
MSPHKFCSFINLQDNEYQCANCGLTIVSEDGDPPLFPCIIAQPVKLDNLCSLSQIEKRYQTCNSCEFFNQNTCTKCDCIITRNLNYTNKLFYKDQECPELKWTKED